MFTLVYTGMIRDLFPGINSPGQVSVSHARGFSGASVEHAPGFSAPITDDERCHVTQPRARINHKTATREGQERTAKDGCQNLSAFRGCNLLSASLPPAFQITSQPPGVSDTIRFYPCFGIFYAVKNLYSRAWGAFLYRVVILFCS